MTPTPHITYSFTRSIPLQQLRGLFQQTTWAATRTVADIEVMLKATPIFLGAWHDDYLVGFARVLTDDCYRAMVEDVIVEQTLRGQGIGQAMMGHVLGRLKHVEEVLLFCVEERIPFYERLGFEQSTYPSVMKQRTQ
ncbi:MAG: N-acetyltransferase [Chloroflexi bacterium AL-W]|nr:N-acetyltransferase [Chloroflexi bacterium AL-N1]NOK70833.1 N-acetyltransferase [Chloroflexi bacterium AL-N10]NOK78393.1 N-acetyltransferase [Chloroflexi bacterium AL-N5]NOK85374.1 N-acetyltransferase [Chloroflexi bacterium AL-W]NOK92650.1 N-acetyltransferase [Chloroflexi bacterium AL-N15]